MTERKQIGGDHYNKHTIQPFDIIDDYGLDFYEGNALKYLLRWRDKNGVVDLEKAKHYIEILIQKERSPDGGNLPVNGDTEASVGEMRIVPSVQGGPVRTDFLPVEGK